MIRVWSLYNRSRRVGLYLLALCVFGFSVSMVAWTLPALVSTLFIIRHTKRNLMHKLVLCRKLFRRYCRVGFPYSEDEILITAKLPKV